MICWFCANWDMDGVYGESASNYWKYARCLFYCLMRIQLQGSILGEGAAVEQLNRWQSAKCILPFVLISNRLQNIDRFCYTKSDQTAIAIPVYCYPMTNKSFYSECLCRIFQKYWYFFKAFTPKNILCCLTPDSGMRAGVSTISITSAALFLTFLIKFFLVKQGYHYIVICLTFRTIYILRHGRKFGTGLAKQPAII